MNKINIFRAVLVIFTFLPLEAYSVVISEERFLDFGEIQMRAYQAATMRSRDFYGEIEKQYKKSCRTTNSNATYEFLNLELNCSFNLLSYFNGNTQRFLDAAVTKLPASHSNFEGASVYLTSPVQVRAEVRSLRQNYSATLLDNKRSEDLVEKPDILNNIRIKHKPSRGTLINSVCMNLPGSEIVTDLSPINLYIKKKLFWFIYLKARVKINIDLGAYRYNEAQICTAHQLSDFEAAARGNIDLKDEVILAKPMLSPITYSGLATRSVSIKGANFITRIALTFARWFKISVEDIAKGHIASMLSSTVSGYIRPNNENIASGRIWDSVASELVNKSQVKLVADIDRGIQDEFSATIGGTISLDQAQIDDLCRGNIQRIEARLGFSLLGANCSTIVQGVDVVPFHNAADMLSKGCYDSSYMLDNSYSLVSGGKNSWWRSDCNLGFRVDLTISDSFMAVYECYRNAVAASASVTPAVLNNIYDNCTDILISSWLNISPEDALSVISSVDLADLRRRLPAATFNRIQNRLRFL